METNQSKPISNSMPLGNIETFQEFLNKLNSMSRKDNFWKSIPEIAEATGSTENQVFKYVDSFDDFVKNRYGKYTTRDLYTKYTSSFIQFYHAWIGKIE